MALKGWTRSRRTGQSFPILRPEPGPLKSRTQLVWNAAANRLTRRAYRAWDPLPSRDYTFVWEPEDLDTDQAGAVSGHGRLSWYPRGAADYDRANAAAFYEGELMDGRPDGEGRFVHRSGVSYQGTWRAGLMHGHGRLQLPNGAEYVGEFSAGRKHGQGVYVDAAGNTYQGGFLAGVRDGVGTLIHADRSTFEARFRDGAEVPGSRRSLRGAGTGSLVKAAYPAVDGLRIGVTVDRQPWVLDNYGDRDNSVAYLGYRWKSDGQTLKVRPDQRRLMAIWKDDAPIQLSPEEEWRRADEGPGLLGSTIVPRPVPLIFEMANQRSSTQRVDGAYLQITSSLTDREPLLHVHVSDYNICMGVHSDPGIRTFTTFDIENYGWGPGENARIRVAFADQSGTRRVGRAEKRIGSLGAMTEVDLRNELEAVGVRLDELSSRAFDCTWDEDRPCVERAVRSGLFGEIGSLVWGDELLHVNAVGTVEYNWRDAAGRKHRKTSPFVAKLQVGRMASMAECGEGGYPVLVGSRSYRLKLDTRNYRIALPLQGEVKPGRHGALAGLVGCRAQLRARLSDGDGYVRR
jgi:hypothetical protein